MSGSTWGWGKAEVQTRICNESQEICCQREWRNSSSWRVEDQGEIFVVGNERLLRVLFDGGEGCGGEGAGKARTVGKCGFPHGRVLD